MALPTIIFNASTGSDTAASGAGPAVAVSGSAAAHTGGIASTTITLTNTPDLSGVATDGSAVLWLKTAAGRQFSKIVGADDGADTVTVEDSFTIEAASAVDYAIGGKRATWDDADSRKLFAADVKSQWAIETETNQTLTSKIVLGVAGASFYQRIVLRGADNTITQTVDEPHFEGSGSTIQYWFVNGLRFSNSYAGVKTANSTAFKKDGAWWFERCVFGHPTNKLYHATNRIAADTYQWFVDCALVHTLRDAIGYSYRDLYLYNCLIADCAGMWAGNALRTLFLINSIVTRSGQLMVGQYTASGGVIVLGNTFDQNLQTPLSMALVPTGQTPFIVANNNFTRNNGYGIIGNATIKERMQLYGFNNFGTGAWANTSGNTKDMPDGVGNVNVDPGYTDPANNDFSVGTALKALGWPDATRYIGANQSLTRSYVDIGAAQRQEAAGGGYTYGDNDPDYVLTTAVGAGNYVPIADSDTVDGGVSYGVGEEGTGVNATTIRTALGLASANLDTQLAAIVADTNELQAELADGGRTDLLIDGIKAKTDTIPASPAEVGSAMTLTSGERTTLAAAIEAAIINELDGTAVMQAIADLIASDMTTTDLTVAAIASACRDAILNRVLSGNHDTAGTPGKLLQNCDAPISDVPTVDEFNARTVPAASIATSTQTAAILDAVGVVDTVVDAIKVKTDGLNFAGTDVKATLDGEEVTPTAASKTGYKLASDGLDSVVIETGLNARQALSIIAASAAGVLDGAATEEITMAAAGVPATNRITATVDENGNRSAVTLSPPT